MDQNLIGIETNFFKFLTEINTKTPGSKDAFIELFYFRAHIIVEFPL